ncbi:unnamed protein product, partial [Hapterophycus canaliculatus]
MPRARLIGAVAPVVVLFVLTYARANAKPQTAFVHHAGTHLNTCQTHRGGRGGSNTSPRHRLTVSQERSNHWCKRDSSDRRQKRIGVAGLGMAGFWAKPPLRETSVLQLPRLGQCSDDVAVVYFSACDLRIHDHDALVAAAGAAGVVPAYVFDDQELAAESRLDAAFAYHAVQDLRKSLRGIGSDLVVRSGDVAEEIGKLAEQAGASHVFFHASPVHALRNSHERVRASLASKRRASGGKDQPQDPSVPAASSPATIDVRSWSASQLTGVDGLDSAQAWNFRDFEKRLQGDSEPARSAFSAPAALPPIPPGIEPGPFPSLEEVLSRVG